MDHITRTYPGRRSLSQSNAVEIVKDATQNMFHFGQLDIRKVAGAFGLARFEYYYHGVRMHAVAVDARGMDFLSIWENGQQVTGHLAFDKVAKIFVRIGKAKTGNEVVNLKLEDRGDRVLFESQLVCVHCSGADVVSALLTLCKNAE